MPFTHSVHQATLEQIQLLKTSKTLTINGITSVLRHIMNDAVNKGHSADTCANEIIRALEILHDRNLFNALRNTGPWDADKIYQWKQLATIDDSITLAFVTSNLFCNIFYINGVVKVYHQVYGDSSWGITKTNMGSMLKIICSSDEIFQTVLNGHSPIAKKLREVRENKTNYQPIFDVHPSIAEELRDCSKKQWEALIQNLIPPKRINVPFPKWSFEGVSVDQLLQLIGAPFLFALLPKSKAVGGPFAINETVWLGLVEHYGQTVWSTEQIQQVLAHLPDAENKLGDYLKQNPEPNALQLAKVTHIVVLSHQNLKDAEKSLIWLLQQLARLVTISQNTPNNKNCRGLELNAFYPIVKNLYDNYAKEHIELIYNILHQTLNYFELHGSQHKRTHKLLALLKHIQSIRFAQLATGIQKFDMALAICKEVANYSLGCSPEDIPFLNDIKKDSFITMYLERIHLHKIELLFALIDTKDLITLAKANPNSYNYLLKHLPSEYQTALNSGKMTKLPHIFTKMAKVQLMDAYKKTYLSYLLSDPMTKELGQAFIKKIEELETNLWLDAQTVTIAKPPLKIKTHAKLRREILSVTNCRSLFFCSIACYNEPVQQIHRLLKRILACNDTNEIKQTLELLSLHTNNEEFTLSIFHKFCQRYDYKLFRSLYGNNIDSDSPEKTLLQIKESLLNTDLLVEKMCEMTYQKSLPEITKNFSSFYNKFFHDPACAQAWEKIGESLTEKIGLDYRK